jgi:hypothetical protein
MLAVVPSVFILFYLLLFFNFLSLEFSYPGDQKKEKRKKNGIANDSKDFFFLLFCG